MIKPDILLFMSDQHAPQYMGGGLMPVDTPNLDLLRKEGTTFTQAYTACPLCVPARMAMLSGMQASKTGIFTNMDALPNTLPTFLHHLVEAGYETVLVGRMHFVGADQRHGFTKRIAPDFTNSGWTRPPWIEEDFGVHTQTMGYKWCTHVVGGGESPVLSYDEMVVRTAEEYLNKPHEKPQFILVGTYGPHFPYVAPPQLFEKYLKTAVLPQTFHKKEDFINPVLESLQEPDANPEVALACQAAYKGLIEHTDALVGRVFNAFCNFTKQRGTQKLFGYLSDHGDTVGEHGIYGKKTFFEKSVKIPLIFAGDGVEKGCSWDYPVTILDVGPTVCQWGNATIPFRADGQSLADILHGKKGNEKRIVLSEGADKNHQGEWVYSCMLRTEQYKFISYNGYERYDMLFDVDEDPLEQENLTDRLPNVYKRLRNIAQQCTSPAAAQELQCIHARSAAIFAKNERATGFDDRERYRDYPLQAKQPPVICITTLTTPPGKEQRSTYCGADVLQKVVQK
ncbi:MAG: sulfatase-like hydrolase/transferase [Oscillospiraceae bacterium]|nr:sulfatase-like hydrolase/transferase [Oscillospiraceae bacterium]